MTLRPFFSVVTLNGTSIFCAAFFFCAAGAGLAFLAGAAGSEEEATKTIALATAAEKNTFRRFIDLFEFLRADVRLVEHLDDDAVGVGEVKRRAAVAMDFERLHDLDAAAAELRFELAHALGALDHEAQMIELLILRRRAIARERVQREIIAPGREIDVFRVRLPDDLHAEAVAIKILRAADVAHFERHVAQSFDASDGGHTGKIYTTRIRLA